MAFLQFVGALYLLKIGLEQLVSIHGSEEKEVTAGNSGPFLGSLASSIFNPKALVYFCGLLAPMLGNPTFQGRNTEIAVVIGSITFIWFGLLAIVASKALGKIKRPGIHTGIAVMMSLSFVVLGGGTLWELARRYL